MNYTISVVVYLVLCVLAITMNFQDFSLSMENLQLFIDFPSLLITLFPAVLFAAGATSWGTLGLALQMSFGSPRVADRAALAAARRCLGVLGNTALITGMLGTLIGAVIMLQNLTEMDALGPASAVALLTVLYGVLIKILCLAAAAKIDYRLDA